MAEHTGIPSPLEFVDAAGRVTGQTIDIQEVSR